MQVQSEPLFTGCATALVTPFLPNNAIDEASLRQLIHRQIQSGIDALVILGTTGEPCTISMEQREQVITIAMDAVQKQIPVIVGTGANDTNKAIEYARQAKALGAQGQLCVTPYYNKATQAGLLRHFTTIIEHSDLPMILYNVPSRTGMCITAETVSALARNQRIVGIKEASGDLSCAMRIIEKTHGSLPIYCGNDDLILPMMAIGAKGAVSVCSNIAPVLTKKLTDACLSGNLTEARSAQTELLPLICALSAEVNPIPAKAALSIMGMIHDELRLPLTPMEEPNRRKLCAVLRQLNLIP